jgi:hypothetical protein
LNRSFGWRIQATEDVHERRFAASRWTNDGNEFAVINVERHIIQRADFLPAQMIDLADISKFNERHETLSENIQHPTSNIQHPVASDLAASWMFGVRCWMLDVDEVHFCSQLSESFEDSDYVRGPFFLPSPPPALLDAFGVPVVSALPPCGR